ncbi:MAG TPA: MFS transporter [Stellaceae bacterium]|jgi:MFS family permease|nr:MFS transporter [Stellaceae bacterium]
MDEVTTPETPVVAATPNPQPNPPDEPHWRRNLAICFFGSFTTLVSMTLLVPFLPVYIQELGVTDHAAITLWSAVAFGATFFAAGLVSPLWGWLADRYGRRPMLIRASLGMAIAMSLMGMAHAVWQLVALRLLAGFLGGYSSSATVFVATQTPKARAGWALGVLSSGITAGGLVGPLVGGVLPPLIGIRETFFISGATIMVAFLLTVALIREAPRSAAQRRARKESGGWRAVPDKRPIIAMLVSGVLVTTANMSIEPIITLYVGQISPGANVTFVAGLIMSAAALGAILSAPRLGKLADRIGHWGVIIGCLSAAALLLVPQAFVTAGWQLILLRLLQGMAMGGLLPCISAVIRHNVPEHVVGTILGYSISAQFVGLVAGPSLGGLVGAHIGLRTVFLATAAVLALGAIYNHLTRRTVRIVPTLQ